MGKSKCYAGGLSVVWVCNETHLRVIMRLMLFSSSVQVIV